MERVKAVLRAVTALAAALCILGCASCGSQNDRSGGASEDSDLVVFEETVSPNEEYATSEDDLVYDTVRVTQNASGIATVSAESNSAFFDPVTYELDCEGTLASDDVSVRWTTLMGSEETSADDMIVIAVVSVKTSSDACDVRKINFVNGGLETVTEAIAES